MVEIVVSLFKFLGLDVKFWYVVIIMDGNGCWVVNKGWFWFVGYCKGVECVKQIVCVCFDMGVNWLMFYVFLIENWKCMIEEVLGLMKIFVCYIECEVDGMVVEGVWMCFIGGCEWLDQCL